MVTDILELQIGLRPDETYAARDHEIREAMDDMSKGAYRLMRRIFDRVGPIKDEAVEAYDYRDHVTQEQWSEVVDIADDMSRYYIGIQFEPTVVLRIAWKATQVATGTRSAPADATALLLSSAQEEKQKQEEHLVHAQLEAPKVVKRTKPKQQPKEGGNYTRDYVSVDGRIRNNLLKAESAVGEIMSALDSDLDSYTSEVTPYERDRYRRYAHRAQELMRLWGCVATRLQSADGATAKRKK